MELAYRSYDAVNRRDLDALLALMDDDVEAVSRIAAMEGGLHGHDGMRRWWESWFSAFPDYKIEVGEVRDRGDFVFAAFSCSWPRRGQPASVRGHGLACESMAARKVHLVARLPDLG